MHDETIVMPAKKVPSRKFAVRRARDAKATEVFVHGPSAVVNNFRLPTSEKA